MCPKNPNGLSMAGKGTRHLPRGPGPQTRSPVCGGDGTRTRRARPSASRATLPSTRSSHAGALRHPHLGLHPAVTHLNEQSSPGGCGYIYIYIILPVAVRQKDDWKKTCNFRMAAPVPLARKESFQWHQRVLFVTCQWSRLDPHAFVSCQRPE